MFIYEYKLAPQIKMRENGKLMQNQEYSKVKTDMQCIAFHLVR